MDTNNETICVSAKTWYNFFSYLLTARTHFAIDDNYYFGTKSQVLQDNSFLTNSQVLYHVSKLYKALQTQMKISQFQLK